jgi:hypothetical protein
MTDQTRRTCAGSYKGLAAIRPVGCGLCLASAAIMLASLCMSAKVIRFKLSGVRATAVVYANTLDEDRKQRHLGLEYTDDQNTRHKTEVYVSPVYQVVDDKLEILYLPGDWTVLPVHKALFGGWALFFAIGAALAIYGGRWALTRPET